MEQVVVAAVAFVATHFLLSHSLRPPIVRRIGEGRFLLLYSVVAAVTLGWLTLSYRAAPAAAFWWPVGDAVWAVATALMLVASILLTGSLIGNPALPDPGGSTRPLPVPRGVYAITRHPMMWAFAIWGLVHVAVYPVAANAVVAAAIVILAPVGAKMQDRKKAALDPDRWPEWQRRTSYWPFAAIVRGRTRFGGFRPHDLAGGTAIWLAATWARQPLAGWAAGVRRWV